MCLFLEIASRSANAIIYSAGENIDQIERTQHVEALINSWERSKGKVNGVQMSDLGDRFATGEGQEILFKRIRALFREKYDGETCITMGVLGIGAILQMEFYS